MTRRQFLATSAVAAAGAAAGCHTAPPGPEPIIDIHQHVNYGGKRDAQWHQIGPARSNEQLIQHQHNMGVTLTILLPAGRPCVRPSTHKGFSNGLEGTCATNEDCMAMAEANASEFLFAANEVPDLEDAPKVIEKYLKKGGKAIAEQKFGVECDSPQMQDLYRLAGDYKVPILMHWQFGMYNFGYYRFDKMLAKYPNTTFVGHAQTFWVHIDKNAVDDPKQLYPKGKVTPGGWTDRYLSDYPNFIGDLSPARATTPSCAIRIMPAASLSAIKTSLFSGATAWTGSGMGRFAAAGQPFRRCGGSRRAKRSNGNFFTRMPNEFTGCDSRRR